MNLRRSNQVVSSIVALAMIAKADCPNDSADAVLGQSSFSSNSPNQPSGLVTAAGLALSNAAAVAVAPSGRLYVSDPDNNRVLSWPAASAFVNGAAADMVFGQPNFVSRTPNNGGVSGHSMSLPQGVAVDAAGNLWVADAFNHRVLRFNNPISDPTPFNADLVIGQVDLFHNDENLGLGGQGPHVALPDSLQFPGRVLVRDADVFVADSGNSRVLHYAAPAANKPLADIVFGQYGNFTCRAKNNDGTCENSFLITAENLKNPIGIGLDAAKRLYICDWANHRVLRFDEPLVSQTADAVYGQPDFSSSGFNSGGAAAGLGLPIDLTIDRFGRLFVADSGNNRIVLYSTPLSNLLPDCVLGQQSDLNTTDINHGLGPTSAAANSLFGPTGLALTPGGNTLIVADTNNQRVLRFDHVEPIISAPGRASLFPQGIHTWPP